MKLYEQNNYEYIPKTEDYVHKNFDNVTEGKEKRYRVDQVYRVKHGTQDFILYNLTTLSTDVFGNEITKNELVGTHPEPKFNKRFDDSTKRTTTVGVAGEEIKYDIPATRKDMEDVLGKSTEDVDTKFVLINGNVRYGSFTAEEFKTKHFDDLLHKAMHGSFPEQGRPFGATASSGSSAEKGFTGKTKETKKGLVSTEEMGSEGGEGESNKDSTATSSGTITTADSPPSSASRSSSR